MTPAALGVFFPKASQEGKAWKVQFTGGGLPEGLVGEYTVLLAEGQPPKASWTHDDADKALLDTGSLNPRLGRQADPKGADRHRCQGSSHPEAPAGEPGPD